MATVTQIQEATNAEGQPIKLAVAYSGEVHGEVLRPYLDSPLNHI